MDVKQNGKVEADFKKPWDNSDAVLVAEGIEFHVHSSILSFASPVFDRMFNGNFKEAATKRVTLEGKSSDVVTLMLHIVYPNLGKCASKGKIIYLRFLA